MEAVQLLKILLLILYLGTFLSYLLLFILKDQAFEKFCHPLYTATLLVHLLFLFSISLFRNHVPLVTRGEAITTTVFCFSALYLFIEIRTRQKSTGPFILALSLAFQLLATYMVNGPREVPAQLASGRFLFHAVLNILGYSGLFLGFIFSTLFLIQNYEIKKHRFGTIYDRLPSLEILDIMSLHSIVTGFCLLSVGIVAGSLWAKQAWGFYITADPKLIATLVVWAIYGVYLALRAFPGWTRKRSAYLSAFGFSALVFAFILVSRIVGTSHNF